MNPTSSSLRAFLRGNWAITRAIDDHYADQTAQFEGHAEFADITELIQGANGLIYQEQGSHLIGTQVFPAKKRYLYLFPPDGSAYVTFEDQSLFHTFDLSPLPWIVTHQCGKDTYTGSFQLIDNHCWVATWQVRGPSKRYETHTRYIRREACATNKAAKRQLLNFIDNKDSFSVDTRRKELASTSSPSVAASDSSKA